MSKVFDWKDKINEEELNKVIDIIKKEELVILPTETVYGLAASAFSDIACTKIFEAKGRAQDNPLIVHVSDKKMIYDIVDGINETEEKLIDTFMPGPFTLILNKKNIICDTVTCGGKTVGIRMPSNRIINEVIKKGNIPLAAPSANVSGRPSGTCIEDIKNEFEGKVDYFVDGGKCDIGIESTVVKVIDGIPTILRPGFITEDDIKEVIGKVALSDKLFKKVEAGEKVESPGMKYRHYAPKTKCILVEEKDTQIDIINDLISKNKKSCVLGFEEDRSKINIDDGYFICLGSKENLKEISSNIFTSLRKVDNLDCSLAIIEGVEKKNFGLSIMNRLVRACENNVM